MMNQFRIPLKPWNPSSFRGALNWAPMISERLQPLGQLYAAEILPCKGEGGQSTEALSMRKERQIPHQTPLQMNWRTLATTGVKPVHWENYTFISFHIEWDVIVVTVLLLILNQMEFHLVQNRKENCHHDHIPFNVRGNGILVFSVYTKCQLYDTKLWMLIRLSCTVTNMQDFCFFDVKWNLSSFSITE